MKGGIQVRRTPRVVYVDGLGSEKLVVLLLGLLREKKCLTGRSLSDNIVVIYLIP